LSERFIYPIFAPGTVDAVPYWVLGEFLLTGHYTGRAVDYASWRRARKEDVPREEGRDEDPYPEFLVESWCYRPLTPPDELSSKDFPAMDRAGVAWCLP
jgi:hypothetical protein